jgi:hypothetical protein
MDWQLSAFGGFLWLASIGVVGVVSALALRLAGKERGARRGGGDCRGVAPADSSGSDPRNPLISLSYRFSMGPFRRLEGHFRPGLPACKLQS